MKEKILALLLNQEKFISGEEISQLLGVSRTAIWKAIKKLKEEGYEIESVSNKGYHVVSVPDKMIKEELKILLNDCKMIEKIFVYDTIDSTNQEAKRHALNGIGHALIVSEEQTIGRGRRGRTWISEKGSGVFMSLLLRPDIRPENASLLTLLAGLAVKRSINHITGLESFIKWPNDIVLNGKKVCGILTEMSSEIDTINYVVVGIGINVSNQIFDQELLDKAAHLEGETGHNINRKELLRNIILEFEELYNQFIITENLEFVIDEYNKSCINVNEIVVINRREGELVGKCTRIDKNGELMIMKDGKEIGIHSGEVSVRGLYGYV